MGKRICAIRLGIAEGTKNMEQQSFALTKNDTKMMQGLAVLAMVCLHLFDTLSFKGKYIPLAFFHGYPLVFYFAQLSDFCVMAFAFCSGYAHMTQYGKPHYYKRRLIGLLGVYLNFWIILVIFTVLSVVIGNGSSMPRDLQTFIGNFTTIDPSYNGAWWYLLTYALIVFSSPLLLRLSQKTSKWKPFLVLVGMGLIYCAAYYVRFNIDSSNWFVHQIGLYGMTAVEYMIGSMACEYKVFSFLGNNWNRIFRNVLTNFLGSAALFAILLLMRTLVVPSLFFAPISGFIVLFLFHKMKKPKWFEKCFLTLGKHSTNIWLTHMFLYLNIFVGLVYRAKFPVPILLFMLAITLPVSVVINLIHKPIFNLIKTKLLKE